MGKYDHAPYEVGKGKPPKATQFKKGVSGNPRGPKHKKKPEEATLSVLLSETLNEKVEVVIRGRAVRVPKKVAIVIQIVNDAMGGTPAQRIKASKFINEVGGFDLEIEDTRMTPEMRDKAIEEVINHLIAEGKRDQETAHLFAEYE